MMKDIPQSFGDFKKRYCFIEIDGERVDADTIFHALQGQTVNAWQLKEMVRQQTGTKATMLDVYNLLLVGLLTQEISWPDDDGIVFGDPFDQIPTGYQGVYAEDSLVVVTSDKADRYENSPFWEKLTLHGLLTELGLETPEDQTE